jgi:hypothetical protein
MPTVPFVAFRLQSRDPPPCLPNMQEHERDQQAMLELATALEAEARGIEVTDLHSSAVLPCCLA